MDALSFLGSWLLLPASWSRCRGSWTPADPRRAPRNRADPGDLGERHQAHGAEEREDDGGYSHLRGGGSGPEPTHNLVDWPGENVGMPGRPRRDDESAHPQRKTPSAAPKPVRRSSALPRQAAGAEVGYWLGADRTDRCLDHVIQPTALVIAGTANKVISHCTGLDGDSRSSGLRSAPVIAAQLHGTWTTRNTKAAMPTSKAAWPRRKRHSAMSKTIGYRTHRWRDAVVHPGDRRTQQTDDDHAQERPPPWLNLGALLHRSSATSYP
jgi:hypothetical protein